MNKLLHRHRMEASNLPINRIPPFAKCFRRGLYGSRFLQRSNHGNVGNDTFFSLYKFVKITVKIFHRQETNDMDVTGEVLIEVRIQV